MQFSLSLSLFLCVCVCVCVLNPSYVALCVLSMVLTLCSTGTKHWRELGCLRVGCVFVRTCGEIGDVHVQTGDHKWIPVKHSDHSLPTSVIQPQRDFLHISHTTRFTRTVKQKRIWPLNDFLGVLPDHVVLAEDEEGPVDGEAVLPDRDGVVQGHGAGTLRFGLLEGWGDATCGHGRSVAVPVALGPSIPGAQQARDVVSKAGHPVKRGGQCETGGRKRRL